MKRERELSSLVVCFLFFFLSSAVVIIFITIIIMISFMVVFTQLIVHGNLCWLSCRFDDIAILASSQKKRKERKLKEKNAAGKCDVIVVHCSVSTPFAPQLYSSVFCKMSQWQQESEMMMRGVCVSCKNVFLCI